MKKEGFDCTEVLDKFLYLGNAKASKNYSCLKEIGITHIVNISGKQHFLSEFKYLRTYFEDSNESNLLENLEIIFKFIDECFNENGKVFIHCMGGVSRSPAVVVGYLIHKNKISFEKAFDIVKKKNWNKIEKRIYKTTSTI